MVCNSLTAESGGCKVARSLSYLFVMFAIGIFAVSILLTKTQKQEKHTVNDYI